MITTEFNEALKVFVEGCQNIHTDYTAREFPNTAPDEISSKVGKRYVKIIRTRVADATSVHCFVDTTNGDVLKAAGWSAPAKHARGNIFDEFHGLNRMGEYGPAYLR